MDSKIGIHLRLSTTLTDIIERANRLKLPFFQTFLTFQNGRHIKLEEFDVKKFIHLRKNFSNLYIHGSYWINLCSSENISYRVLEKEIFMTKRLEFTHLILHPGSANGCKTRLEGIDNLARSLNRLLKKENNISIILENTTHGNFSIGGDLNDFQILLVKIDKPEKINFCIDTAHAYSFGYDISNNIGQDNFVSLIEKCIGKDKVVLIHLNDTLEKLGEKIDRHNIPGQGNIGKDALTRFVNEFFPDTPIILEFPQLSEEQEKENLEIIKKWKI